MMSFKCKQTCCYCILQCLAVSAPVVAHMQQLLVTLQQVGCQLLCPLCVPMLSAACREGNSGCLEGKAEMGSCPYWVAHLLRVCMREQCPFPHSHYKYNT